MAADRRSARVRLGVPVALLGVVTLVGAAGLVLGPSAGGTRSTLDRGPEGTAALAGVVGRLGVEVESLRVGLVPLVRRPEGSVLVMPSEPGLLPSSVVGDAELELLERFMARGSTLVVATHYPTAVLQEWNVDYVWDALERPGRTAGAPRWNEARPLLPHPVTLGGPLAIVGRGGIESGPTAEVLFAVDDVAVVLSRPVGKGALVVVADPTTITNAGIGREGNLDFWVSLIRHHLQPDGVVMFDDLHAGAADDHGVVAYARRAGMVPAMLLVLVLGALYLWRAGSRLGEILPPLDERNPRASSELVHALASLYQRAGLQAHALAVISRRFRRRMERRSGLPWDRKLLDPWVAQELGTDAARAFGRIRRGFAALLPEGDPDRDATLELARLVHRFEQTWLRPTRAGHGALRRRPKGS